MIPALLIAGAIEITSANLYTGDKYVPCRWNEIEISAVSSKTETARFSVIIDSVTFEYSTEIFSGMENRVTIPVFFCGDSGICKISISGLDGETAELTKAFVAAETLLLCKNSGHSHDTRQVVVKTVPPAFRNTFESFSETEWDCPGIKVLQQTGGIPVYSENLRKIILETLASEKENVGRAAALLTVVALIGIAAVTISIYKKKAAAIFVLIVVAGCLLPFIFFAPIHTYVVEDISVIDAIDGVVQFHFLSVKSKPGSEATLKRQLPLKPVVTRDRELEDLKLKYVFCGPVEMKFVTTAAGSCAFAGVSFEPSLSISGHSSEHEGVIPRYFPEINPELRESNSEKEIQGGLHRTILRFRYSYGVKR